MLLIMKEQTVELLLTGKIKNMKELTKIEMRNLNGGSGGWWAVLLEIVRETLDDLKGSAEAYTKGGQ